MSDPLSCSFDEARANHLRDGIRMSTEAKIAWFEEIVALAHAVGAGDRRPARDPADAPHATEALPPAQHVP